MTLRRTPPGKPAGRQSVGKSPSRSDGTRDGSVAGGHPGFGIPIRWPAGQPGSSAEEPVGRAVSDDQEVPPDEPGRHSDQQARPTRQDAQKVEISAVRLLARREHSSVELRRKLRARGHDGKQVDEVLARLEKNRLQSDERFASSYVGHHARRGQGPVRIRAELRQQGISDAQIDQQLAAADQDWTRLAAEVRQRKFGAGLPRTASERAKQARFLQYRGFNSDQIRAALDFDPDVGEP